MARKPSVTKEQIAQAREVDLLSYLQARDPAAIKPTGNGNEYRLVAHDSFKISNGKWHWFSRGFGGNNALDYLVKVQEMDFVTAVSHLCGMQPGTMQRHQPQTEEKPKVPFKLPLPCRDNEQAVQYLLGRGIDREVIDLCLANGSVYESVTPIYQKGEDGRLHPRMGYDGREMVVHNCTFAGFNRIGVPKFACSRGFTGVFKQDVDSSEKQHNFLLPALSGTCEKVSVSESAIDALSDATLRKLKGEGWRGFHYLASSGTSPLALMQFLRDHPAVTEVYIGTDNDEAGRSGIKAMMREVLNDTALFRQVGFITPQLPPLDMDKNEYLRFYLKNRTMKYAHPKKQTAAHSR